MGLLPHEYRGRLVFPVAVRLLSSAIRQASQTKWSAAAATSGKAYPRAGQIEMERGAPVFHVGQFLCCSNSALRSAVSFTRKPIFGCDGSRSGVMPYSRRVSDVTGPIDPITVRRNALAAL